MDRQDETLQGNEKIEVAIQALQKEATQEQLAHTLTVIRRRMKDSGQVIVAVEPSIGTTQMNLKMIQTSDGANWWYAFTSFNEEMKGADSVKSTFLVDIDKLYNNITIKPYNQNSQNELGEKLKKYQEHLLKQTVCDRLGMNLCIKPDAIKQVIVEFIETCYGEIVLKPNEFAVETYFIHWVKAKPNRVQESIENQAKKRHHEQKLQAK